MIGGRRAGRTWDDSVVAPPFFFLTGTSVSVNAFTSGGGNTKGNKGVPSAILIFETSCVVSDAVSNAVFTRSMSIISRSAHVLVCCSGHNAPSQASTFPAGRWKCLMSSCRRSTSGKSGGTGLRKQSDASRIAVSTRRGSWQKWHRRENRPADFTCPLVAIPAICETTAFEQPSCAHALCACGRRGQWPMTFRQQVDSNARTVPNYA